MAAILGLIEPEIRHSIRRPRKPYIEPNLKWIDHPLRRYGHSKFEYHEGCISDPIFTIQKSDGGFLSIGSQLVSVELTLTIRPQFAIECLRRSNQQGWVTLDQNLGLFPGVDP